MTSTVSSSLRQFLRRCGRRLRIRRLVRDLDHERKDEIAAVAAVIRYVTEGRRPSFSFDRRAADALAAMKAIEALPRLRRLLKKSPHGYRFIDYYWDSTHGGPEEYADYQWPAVVKEVIEALNKIEGGRT